MWVERRLGVEAWRVVLSMDNGLVDTIVLREVLRFDKRAKVGGTSKH